ncbi:dihydroxyacetone kinase family protein [Amycolatopsis albispora]|uniref:Dihydroxyacetone kinase n=1 Tax=Amycolatopsis albispora TaxID=1804986 RepID=A0A344KZE4_9PSEU|nr:dihydroxyacetone kinase family protein [Amycolatopsis albispora]AXB41168.1 dihydroxyacetone kinase [Amycolatopsis albispora]
MTLLHNDPAAFAVEALEGFAAANARHVLPVTGGVVRGTVSPAGQVALVLGGGSGHYPAFAGWVGPGFAHGAACGHVFASPSASQVCSVARAAHAGGGVLLGFGNYAGDVLHFGQAAERLRVEGIDVRVLPVTDDIASAPVSSPELRRGIAGDLLVFKIAGAAAERGDDLDGVERVALAARAATRSLGVAFSGCTLPGAEAPLFTVEPGHLAVGLGIHGEPGLSERKLHSADEVADILADGVLAERPAGADRAAVLLNGLGTTKYEELFVVYRRVAARLRAAGLEVVDPVVGEQVTSLDMAGVSLSITFLDAELAELWQAPADTPAYRKGNLPAGPLRTNDLSVPNQPEVVPGSEASQRAAAVARDALHRAAAVLAEWEKWLGELDAVAGDGDHGIGMSRGSAAAASAADTALAAGAGVRTLLARAGEAWSDHAGGTSGALWGAALTVLGGRFGDHDPVTPEAVAEAVRAAVDAVIRLGGAQPGDKTLVDAATPFAEELAANVQKGASLDRALAEAAARATTAATGTARIAARRGRSRTHGDRSIGTPDPGATSFALVMTALSTHGGD